MKNSIGVMAAMPEELEAILELFSERKDPISHGSRVFHQGMIGSRQIVAAFSRCGKVAAAATATEMIVRFHVDAIVFSGLAGALAVGVRIGDLMVPEVLIQHDLDARPLFPRFEVPLMGIGSFATDERLRQALRKAAQEFAAHREPGLQVHGGLLVTGDQFVADDDRRAAIRSACPDAVAVDMEAAAVAQVAHDYGVPLAVIRFISDAADGNAGEVFMGALKVQARQYAHEIFCRFFCC